VSDNNTSFDEILDLSTSEPDEVIAYGRESDQQIAELWLPDSASNVPVVILIHGGCWQSAYNLGHVRPVCAALTKLGMAAWSIEYRRIGDPGGGWPGTFADVLSAISALDQLDRPEIDYDRKILMGHSSGGHLALWAAAAFDAAHPFQGSHRGPISAVVGLAAISDLESYAMGVSACELATRELLSGLPAESPDLYKWASPLRLGAHPRTVLIHGDADGIVPITQSENFAQQKSARLHSLPGVGHFDLIHPGSIAWLVIESELISEINL
jgi:acetyl esterase/lipase